MRWLAACLGAMLLLGVAGWLFFSAPLLLLGAGAAVAVIGYQRGDRWG